MMVDQSRLGSTAFTASILRHVSREYFVSGGARYLQAGELLLEGPVPVLRRSRHHCRPSAVSHGGSPVRLRRRRRSQRRSTCSNSSTAHGGSRDFWHVLAQGLLSARFNAQYADVNAAGSAFALCCSSLWGLAPGARTHLETVARCGGIPRARIMDVRVPHGAPRLPGRNGGARSRGGTNAHEPARTRRGGGRLRSHCSARQLAVIYAPTRGNQKASSIAARVRVEMARTTMRMVAEEPIFGIGLGEFYQRSGEFSSPELLALFPPAHHENAHNNFLQILAETGLVGLATFVVLLSGALYRASKPSGETPASMPWRGALSAACVAFLLTCFGGHPLLTREAAYSFWMVLGLAVGHSLHADPPGPADTDICAGPGPLPPLPSCAWPPWFRSGSPPPGPMQSSSTSRSASPLSGKHQATACATGQLRRGRRSFVPGPDRLPVQSACVIEDPRATRAAAWQPGRRHRRARARSMDRHRDAGLETIEGTRSSRNWTCESSVTISGPWRSGSRRSSRSSGSHRTVRSCGSCRTAARLRYSDDGVTRADFSRRFSASQPLSIICSSARALTTAVLRTARRSFSTAPAPSSAANFPSQRRNQAAAASVVCEPGRGVEDVRKCGSDQE